MTRQLDSIVAHLADREAIRDCLARYCRGIDRRDRSLLESVYWPDAVDDHVQYTGSGAGFINWVLPLLDGLELTQHSLGQCLIKLNGNEAFVESYFSAYHLMRISGALHDVWLGGRYIDRFEKRDTIWRLAYRRLVGDWHRTEQSPVNGWDGFCMGPFPVRNIGTGNADDPSALPFKGQWF